MRVSRGRLAAGIGAQSEWSGPANPLLWLHCARALTPLRLAEIALARIGPSAPIVIKDFAEFVEHFCFNPDTPAGKSFAGGPGRAFFFPSSTHRGNFEQVRPLNFRFRHNLECYLRILKTRCLFAEHLQCRFFELAMNFEVWAGESAGNEGPCAEKRAGGPRTCKSAWTISTISRRRHLLASWQWH